VSRSPPSTRPTPRLPRTRKSSATPVRVQQPPVRGGDLDQIARRVEEIAQPLLGLRRASARACAAYASLAIRRAAASPRSRRPAPRPVSEAVAWSVTRPPPAPTPDQDQPRHAPTDDQGRRPRTRSRPPRAASGAWPEAPAVLGQGGFGQNWVHGRSTAPGAKSHAHAAPGRLAIIPACVWSPLRLPLTASPTSRPSRLSASEGSPPYSRPCRIRSLTWTLRDTQGADAAPHGHAGRGRRLVAWAAPPEAAVGRLFRSRVPIRSSPASSCSAPRRRSSPRTAGSRPRLAISASGIVLFWVAHALARAGWARSVLALMAAAITVAAATSLLQAYGVETELFSLNRSPGGTLGNRNFVAHLAAIGIPLLIIIILRAATRPALCLAPWRSPSFPPRSCCRDPAPRGSLPPSRCSAYCPRHGVAGTRCAAAPPARFAAIRRCLAFGRSPRCRRLHRHRRRIIAAVRSPTR